MEFLQGLFIVLGAIFCPILTIGCILIHFGWAVCGGICVAISLIQGFFQLIR